MPFTVREMLLVVRARDVASRVVREVGTSFTELDKKARAAAMQSFNHGAALTGIGVAIGSVGAVGLNFFNNATNAAIEYNRTAALTLTQVDQAGVKVRDLEDIGKRVAGKIPIPFEQMQVALYDIFSSMDIGTRDAEKLLALFSKGAVAGQTDVQTAARSTISVMNAYGKPFSEAGDVMDIMFEMVRKGVGTYEEFNTAIGRAIPASVAASQEFETLAGVMAFLTRAGLSTQMAATSAARAMELFSKPEVVDSLRSLGVEVVNSQGDFKQLDEILRDLAGSKGWAQLGDAQRKKLFEDIFGGGTIQARRFFDVAIPNFEQFVKLTDITSTSAGALGEAYNTMFETPAMKAELLRNKYKILTQEIGDQLIPAKIRLMEAVGKVLDWWLKLDDGTKKWIIRIAALAAGLMTLIGVVLTVAGVWVMLSAAAILAGTTMGALLITVGIVVVAIVALIAIGVLLVKNWSTVKEWAGIVWHAVRDFALEAWQTMQDFWDWVSSNAVSVWHTVQSAAVDAWGVVSGAIKTAWSTITSVIARGVDMAIGAASTLWGWLRTAGAWLSDNFGAGFMKVWDALSKAVSDVVSEIMPTLEALWSYIQWGWEHVVGPALRLMGTAWQEHVKLFVTLLMAVVMPTLTALWDGFKLVFLMVTTAAKIFWENIKLTFNLIWIHIKTVFSIIKSVIEIGVGIILAIWENFGPIILNSVKATWTFITDTISAAIKLVSNVIQLVMNIIQGDWSEAWENVKNILNAAWELVWAAIKFFGSLILTYFRDLPGKIVSFIGDVGRLLWNKGSDIINSLWNGIKAIWEKVRTWFLGSGGRGGVKNAIVNFFSNAKDWLISAGKNIINGIKTGITNAIDAIGNFFSNIKDKIVQGFKDAFNIGSPSKVMMGVGRDIIWGLIEGAWTKVKDIPKLVRSIGLSFMDIVKIVGEGAWGALGSIGDALGIDSLVDMFSGGGGGGGSSGVQKLAQQMASMYGWIGAQWDALKALVQGESGWNPNAQNPTSTAYGLFQFLNSTWAGVGATKTSDPAGQIQAGLEYIRQRYGTPLDAYRAWLSRSPHWYEKGAWNLLTDQLAFLHKGEMVVPSPVARVLRSTADMGPPRGSAGATFNFHGPVSFGSERATDDFDFWTRTKLSGV